MKCFECGQEISDDDGEPITFEWLTSIGFEPDTGLGMQIREEENGYAVAVTYQHERWDYMGRWIKSPKTRGDVRRLLACLGITTPMGGERG